MCVTVKTTCVRCCRAFSAQPDHAFATGRACASRCACDRDVALSAAASFLRWCVAEPSVPRTLRESPGRHGQLQHNNASRWCSDSGSGALARPYSSRRRLVGDAFSPGKWYTAMWRCPLTPLIL